MHYSILDFLVDIAQNSCEASASRVDVSIEEDETGYSISVSDDGSGMDEATLNRALDPFFTDGAKHPGRRVGLGLPFLRQAIELNGGAFSIESKRGNGTTVRFSFDRRQIDCPPLGVVPEALISIVALPGAQDIRIWRRRSGLGSVSALDYRVSKLELGEILGNLEEASSLVLVKRYLQSQEED
jgi:hypothetical protein